MGIKDDIIKSLRDMFKVGLYDDQGVYEYSEGGEDDDWDHRWQGDGVKNSVMAYEGEDGWAVSVGNGQELFSQTVAEGVTEDEMEAAVSAVTGEYQGESPMDEGYITLEDMDEIQSIVDESLTESEGSDGGDDPESYAPGPEADAGGEESTELGADVSELVEGAESAPEGSDEDGGDDPEEDEEAADEAESDPETGETAEGQEEGGEDGGGGGNPWVSYQGQAGGQGWQNVITGEIRYQDEQPAPTEEEQEQMAEQQAVVEPEQNLSEGDPVTVDMPMTGEQSGVIAGTGQNEGGEEYIEVQLEDGEVQAVTPDMIESDPSAAAQQEPGDGFADGWSSPPDDFSDVDTGDYVEVFEAETGEWHTGQKTQGGMGDYMMVQLENGEEIELLRGTDTGYVATAVEDPVEGIPFEEEDFVQLEMDDEVLFDSPGYGMIETRIVSGYTEFDEQVKVEDKDGDFITLSAEQAEERLYHDPPEWSEWEFGDDTDMMARFEGEYVKYNHPSRGVVSGPLTVQEDGEGDLWFHIDGDDNGEGENCSGFTSKADHPLNPESVDMLEVDNPFDEWRPSQLKRLKRGDQIRVDGEIMAVEAVDMDGIIEADGSDELIVSTLEMAEEYDATVPEEAWVPQVDAPEVPEDAEDGWEEPPSIEEAGTDAYYSEGDMVWFVNDDHEPQLVEVEGIDQYGDIVIEDAPLPGNEETISGDLVEGHAPIEEAALGESVVEPSDVSQGEVITYDRLNQDGEVETFTALVDEVHTGGLGDDEIDVTLLSGGTGSHTVIPSSENIAVTGVDSDYDPYDALEFDGSSMDSEEIADTIMDDLGFDIEPEGQGYGNKDGYLSKSVWWFTIEKSQQQDLKDHFAKFFPANEVDHYFDAIAQWKASSDPDADYTYDGPYDEPNRRASSAMAYALGLEEAPVRGEPHDSDRPIPFEEDELGEWVDMAEATAELSQRFFTDQFLDGDQNGTTTDIARGGAGVTFRSFMNSFLDNPEADEFGIDGSAFMNYDGERNEESNTWKQWSFAPEISANHVGLMTDYMFNPDGVNSGENEIWVTSENLKVSPENIGLGEYTGSSSRKRVFDNGIEGMDDDQTERVAAYLDEYWGKMRGSDKFGIDHGDDWSETQVATLNRIADQIEANNVSGHTNLKNNIRGLAGDFGLQPSDWRTDDSPDIDADTDTPDTSSLGDLQAPEGPSDLALGEGDYVETPGGNSGTIMQVDDEDMDLPYKVDFDEGGNQWYAQENLKGQTDEDIEWTGLETSDNLSAGDTIQVENDAYGNIDPGVYTVEEVDGFGDIYVEGQSSYISPGSGNTEVNVPADGGGSEGSDTSTTETTNVEYDPIDVSEVDHGQEIRIAENSPTELVGEYGEIEEISEQDGEVRVYFPDLAVSEWFPAEEVVYS